jgi:hypothetical protein
MYQQEIVLILSGTFSIDFKVCFNFLNNHIIELLTRCEFDIFMKIAYIEYV